MKAMTDTEIRNLTENCGLNADTLQNTLVDTLTERGMKIATAESCTGGLVSERITSVSGASGVFDCGICSYANKIKEKLLGVSSETLKTLGAVSAETAVQMAEGVRRLAGADIGISTTGIAGPTGGTPQKPVGTVFVGVSTEKSSFAVRLNLGGENADNSREYIRKSASDAALLLAINEIGKL